jgi:multiple sugar transport system permease protein
MMSGQRPKKKRKKVDGHTVMVYGLLFFGAFLLLVPFYWMLSNSLKTEAEAQIKPPTMMPMASYIELNGESLEVSRGEEFEADDTVRVTVKMPKHPLAGETINVPTADLGLAFGYQIEVDGDKVDVILGEVIDGGVEVTLQAAGELYDGEVRSVAVDEVIHDCFVDYQGHPTMVSYAGAAAGDSRDVTVLDQPHPLDGEQYVVAQGDVTRRLTPRWGNYPAALERMNFAEALANTTVITVLCVIGQILSSSLVGFGFARFRFRGRNFLFMLMLSTMMLPPQVSMIPLFILFRNLGMIDSIWPLVIPMWLGSPFYVFMFRQFFTQVPEELVEAARIDGAGNWKIYSWLMLPLSGPVIAIVAIYTFMFVWNDFLGPLIYLNSPDQRTLTLALNAFNGSYGVSDVQLLMAASFVTMLPCILLFFAAQRYFVQSTASSGLKG